MNRVLIIGPDFHYFNASIERAFRALGWETRVEAYSTPIHPYTKLAKIRYKFSNNKLALKQASRIQYDIHIRESYNQFRPNIVFVLNGDNITSNTMAYFHKSAKVIIWLYDSVTRMMYAMDNLREADRVYCYEQTDIPILAQEGISASFLPQAVDTTLYFPIKGIDKKYDIAFAGEIWNSQRRQQLLQAVVRHFPNRRIRIVGRYKIIEKGFWRWLFRNHRDIFTNKNTTVEELNILYNESRVVLNIHNEQQFDGANPKVYEILASGSHEVCDRNPYIEQLFGNCLQMSLYDDVDEMLSLIEDILARPDEVYTTDMTEHTFVKRIEMVLSSI